MTADSGEPEEPSSPPAPDKPKGHGAKFLTGSPMRHIVVMTTTASIGLMSLFAVDLVDMYFLSLLGEVELAAAVGFGGTILFFTTSVCIGLAISMGALVSRRIGAGDEDAARRAVTNVFVFAILITVPFAALIWLEVPRMLGWLGAQGRAAELATAYLRIVIPSMPVLAIAMAGGGALRGIGDARRAMNATLFGGIANAVLDPIFIFSLDMGIEGAAWASVIGRVVVVAVSLDALVRKRGLIAQFSLKAFTTDMRPVLAVAAPAVAMTLATPVGNAYVTASIAQFGDSAVAGISIIGRLLPVAFGMVFAVAGAVGPIVGQNYGAQRLDRVRRSMTDALIFVTAYCTSMALILTLARDFIVSAFGIDGEAAALVVLFCTVLSFAFTCNGWFFVANAAFNNLGRSTWAMIANWARNTLGTIPFVYAGGLMGGAAGALTGQAVGAVLVGTFTYALAYRLVRTMGTDEGPHEPPPRARFFRTPFPAFSEVRGWMGLPSRE